MPDVTRVPGTVGSPETGANKEILVREVMAGAAEAGAENEVVRLCDLQVDPCRACNGYRGEGICIADDNMQELVGRMMDRSRAWVLGTRVYW